MTVYVDDMFAPYGRMLMCHLVADSTEELLGMADRIGVQHKWIQHAGTHKEHFDIASSKRSEAIRAGAVRITWRACGAMVALRRETGRLGSPQEAMAVHQRRAEEREKALRAEEREERLAASPAASPRFQDRWICLGCKSSTPGVHGKLDDGVTPCDDGMRQKALGDTPVPKPPETRVDTGF